jgi:hypothetical protein
MKSTLKNIESEYLMSSKKVSTEKKESAVKKVTVNDMLTVMKALDSKCIERKTSNDDIAVQCFSTVNAERCELWKRSESRYDIYIGNATNIAKTLNNDFSAIKNMSNAVSVLTYVDDKKMSKRETRIKISDKKGAFELVKKVVAELKKSNKKVVTKEKKESEREQTA